MDIGNIIAAICVVGGVGLVFGLLLALAAHIFAVKKDERTEKNPVCSSGCKLRLMRICRLQCLCGSGCTGQRACKRLYRWKKRGCQSDCRYYGR